MVRYYDENRKLHYVNTETTKVPERYMDQIRSQLPQNNPTLPNTEQPNLPTGLPLTMTPPVNAQPLPPEERLQRMLTAKKMFTDNRDSFPPEVSVDDIFFYYDENNVKQPYSENDLNQIPERYLPQVDQQIISMENMLRHQMQQPPSNSNSIGTRTEAPEIQVFVEDNCQDCTRLQILLNANKISYQTYDVNSSPIGKEFYKTMAPATLPATKIGAKIILGNDINAIKSSIMSGTINQAPVQDVP